MNCDSWIPTYALKYHREKKKYYPFTVIKTFKILPDRVRNNDFKIFQTVMKNSLWTSLFTHFMS